jgi:acyl-CoA synthetase (AMP-forming)/AMP-acid ligase II
MTVAQLVPTPSRNVAALLDQIEARCVSDPSAPALIQAGGRIYTYGEVKAELDALTSGLLNAGMRPGDAVVYSVRPSPESVLLLLAVVRCGGVVVAVDPGMSPELFAARLSLLDPRWVMAESILYALAQAAPLRRALERKGVRLPSLRVRGARLLLQGRPLPWVHGALYYRDLAGTKAAVATPDVDPNGTAVVVFTSGTTSMPKGVVHSRASIGAGLAMVAAHLALRPTDCLYTDQLHMIVPALMAGASVVIPRRRSNAGNALADLAAYGPTHAYWVPVQLEEIVSRARAARVAFPKSLEAVILASAPVPRSFLRRIREALPPKARVYSAYAMTEMLPVCFVEMGEKLAYEGTGDLVGAPCPEVRVGIAADGEVIVAGPNLCQGYLGGPPLLEVATGDLGRVDADGRLVLLGRKKDMIIRGAYNIYPGLFEETVAAIPGVHRCALVGVYDEKHADEVVVLALEPQPGCDPSELRHRVMHEISEGPHRIDIQARPDHIVVSDIPLSGRSRKVDKGALREAIRELGLC